MQRKYQDLMHFPIEEDAVKERAGAKKLGHVDEIIHLMAGAGLFAGAEDENRALYEALMTGCDKVAVFGVVPRAIVNGKEQAHPFAGGDKYTCMHGHNIDNLLVTYQLLAKHHVLTATVHLQLMSMLADTWLHLAVTKRFLTQLDAHNAMTSGAVNAYFEDPYSGYDMFNALKGRDDTGITAAFVLENVDLANRKAFASFTFGDGDDLTVNNRRHNWLYNDKAWMTADVIKVMAANGAQCEKVVPLFLAHCDALKLYERAGVECQFPEMLADLFLLKKHDMPLSIEIFKMTMNRVFPGKAIAVCRESGYLGIYSGANHVAYQLLLTNHGLMNALTNLHDFHLQCREGEINYPLSDLKQDIGDLFKAADRNVIQVVQDAIGGLFSNPVAESLQQVVDRLHVRQQSMLLESLSPQHN